MEEVEERRKGAKRRARGTKAEKRKYGLSVSRAWEIERGIAFKVTTHTPVGSWRFCGTNFQGRLVGGQPPSYSIAYGQVEACPVPPEGASITLRSAMRMILATSARVILGIGLIYTTVLDDLITMDDV